MKKAIFAAAFLAALLFVQGFFVLPAATAQLVPVVPDLTGIVKDKNWALVLGKALFWDQQAGSDGQACASCHFSAGADSRLKNQLTPGFTDITYGPGGDTEFGSERSDLHADDPRYVWPGTMPSGAIAGPNYTLKPADMPMHRLLDETDRDSPIITTTNDRISSQGSFDSMFSWINNPALYDICGEPSADIFNALGWPARQVEPRNTPTTINAVFNHRNFWDGRANNMFNGVGVFGMRDIIGDPQLRLVVLDGGGNPQLDFLELENSSLASQACAPPLSEKEMSCNGRTFPELGQKMLMRRPLATQSIDPGDSLLGNPGPFGDLRAFNGKGLKFMYKYADLIKNAFEDKYWNSNDLYRIDHYGQLTTGEGYTQMEINFSMFWGIAVMLYEQTLISDQSEFDTLTAQGKLIAAPAVGVIFAAPDVDPLMVRGAQIFFGAPFPPFSNGSGCAFCHAPPTFTENGQFAGSTFTPFLNPVTDVNNVLDIRDLGFANIGIRPVFSDLLVGGTDPYGFPLSFGRQYKTGMVVDPYLQESMDGGKVQTNIVDGTVSKLEADGAAKIPTMRNVALTPPYFLWGGYPNLRQVLKVYNRGGNRRQITGSHDHDAQGCACTSGDDSGSGPDGDQPYPVQDSDCNTNTTGLMTPLGLSDCDAPDGTAPRQLCLDNGQTVETDDLAALERFLKSLTDYRVQCDQAPFDHPSLIVFHGHRNYDRNLDGMADDITFELPAVGSGGYDPYSGFCIPNAGDLFAPGMQARAGGKRVPLQE